jgi:Initiator Replication protein.
MDNDFKTWVGIIHAFAKYNVTNDKVVLPFVEFVKLCGIPSSRSSAKLRERLEASLIRIASNTIQFGTADKDELYVTHLVQSAKYSVKKDTVELQADPKLFELYQFDRKVLLQLRAINALARKESAQALYTFIESLPPKSGAHLHGAPATASESDFSSHHAKMRPCAGRWSSSKTLVTLITLS